MYCGSKTIAIRRGDKATAFALTCRAWSCPTCAPRRRQKLICQALDGSPNRFVTLTVNPHWYDSPEERGAKLSEAWRDFVRDFRKRHKTRTLEYLAVLELTKKGEPHLHIMVRGSFISYQRLSAWMGKRMGAPIVDIRLVRGQERVAQYVSKYISKRPCRLGNLKRYWCSLGWLSAEQKQAKKDKKKGLSVWLIDYQLHEFKQGLKSLSTFLFDERKDIFSWRMFAWEPAPQFGRLYANRVR